MRVLNGLSEALRWVASRPTPLGDPQLTAVVARIITDVRARGDLELLDLGEKHDGVRPGRLLVPAGELREAHARVDPGIMQAIRTSISRVRDYYSHQQEAGFTYAEGDASFGMLVRPVATVGCYVPGGQAPLFSSLIMTAVPAQVAGVRSISVASPPGPDGLPAGIILATAFELGISRVYAVGGAQAVAALAFGTETVRRVDKIVGPGSRFVVEAMRQVYGHTGISSLPGPTETLVVADHTAEPGHVMSDLLAQAEHDSSVPVLVTDDAALIESVASGIERQAADLPTAETALGSLRERGALMLVDSLSDAMTVANAFAPEHLCLLVEDPDALLPLVENAGGIFKGHWSMEALGDYAAGPSHVMPTGTSARFASFTNLRDFQRVVPVIDATASLVAGIGPAAARLAREEGLEAHARAIESRLK